MVFQEGDDDCFVGISNTSLTKKQTTFLMLPSEIGGRYFGPLFQTHLLTFANYTCPPQNLWLQKWHLQHLRWITNNARIEGLIEWHSKKCKEIPTAKNAIERQSQCHNLVTWLFWCTKTWPKCNPMKEVPNAKSELSTSITFHSLISYYHH